MGVKINFINPFGTPVYNDLIKETLLQYARPDTEVVVTNTKNCPENIDYYYNKHIIELVIMEDVMRAEQEGYDAVIVGCCYDPGVRVARELVDIPVIGPLEATIMMSPYYGHDYVLVTDHHKAVPYLRDMVKVYGGPECRDVTCIDWFVTEMIRDTAGVAKDAIEKCRAAMEKSRAEVVVLGCTIIAASMEKWYIDTKAPRELTILNTNTFSLKMAEGLADLKQRGLYNINRGGYYQKPQQRNAGEFAEVRARFGRPAAL